MEANTCQDNTVNGSEDIASMGLKRPCLSNGTTDQELVQLASDKKLPLGVIPEIGLACNGIGEAEDAQVSSDCKGSEDVQVPSDCKGSEDVQEKLDILECVKEKQEKKPSPTKADSDIVQISGKEESLRDSSTNENVSVDEFNEEQNDCYTVEDKTSESDKSTPSRNETSSHNHTAAESELNSEKARTRRKRDISPAVELTDLTKDGDHAGGDSIKEAVDVQILDEVMDTTESGDEVLIKEEGTTNSYVKISSVGSKASNNKDGNNRVKGTGSEVRSGLNKNQATANAVSKVKVDNKSKQMNLPKNGVGVKKNEQRTDFSNDDIEFIGESRVVKASKVDRSSHHISPHVASSPVGQGLAITGSSVPTSLHISPSIRGIVSSPALSQGFIPGRVGPSLAPGFHGAGGGPGHGPHNVSLFVPPIAPPKPKSSLDQIELIRWEIQNRISTRPKYFKPCSSSELGPLAKFLFDIGSDLIKEAVYHDLVKIQSRKNSNDKLSDKEKQDLGKLKQIEKDLSATIGHLKLKLKKRCKVCHFQTESDNVMFYHKQYPHEDNKFMRCALCSFVTKQTMAFKSHMESGHGIQAKLNDKKAFHECDLCPYENNQEQKLTLHKQRCIKQFRPMFNLHPSCLSGAEINLCLENIFYKPIIPKNLKFLQQKHAQQQAALAEAKRQQAALAEAKRQQAEVQALAGVKKAAVSVKKQQLVPRSMPGPTPRFSAPPSGGMMQQPVRYNANSKGARLTVANMLNNKQNPLALPTATTPNAAPGGFEVCEICGGYVKDRKALRIHFFYAHRIDLPLNLFERSQAPLYCATCYVRFWTAQGLRKHIDSHKEENQTRGVVGKCISCGHHVLNLLLHMRVVHNHELQHYVNALVCMFCGSHFGSRQECERHITKAHGHVDPVTGTLKPSTNVPVQQPTQKAPSNQKKAANNSFVKGSVCVLCNLNFGRNVDLTRHCMRMHHTCMKCGMVVIDKASLMKHTCLSSSSGTRDCSLCQETGFHPAYYVKHLRDKHLKKFSVGVSKLSSQTIERWSKHPEAPGEELPEGLDYNASLSQTSSAEITPIKRPKIGPASKTGRSHASPPAGVGTEDLEPDVVHESLGHEERVDITMEDSSADVDSQRGDKRKLLSASPGSEEPSKRHKPS